MSIKNNEPHPPSEDAGADFASRPTAAAMASPEGKKAIVEATAKYLSAPLLIDALAWAIKREAEYPSSRELRQRLAKMEKAAKLLMRELTDLRIAALVSDGDQQREIEDVDLARDLRSLALRIADVLQRNPPKQGRRKLYPASGPNPLEICALIVSIIHHRINRKWPGDNNNIVRKCCENLWVAAGGSAHGGVAARNGNLAAWDRHIKAARKYRPPHAAGSHVDRILQQGGLEKGGQEGDFVPA
jgi:hypothetical protein